jgi:hypothetical protein
MKPKPYSKPVKKWKNIAESKVRLIWTCECGNEFRLSPSFVQQGNPVCPDCDVDMIYTHTEVKQ